MKSSIRFSLCLMGTIATALPSMAGSAETGVRGGTAQSPAPRPASAAPTGSDLEMRLRAEEASHSAVMSIIHQFSDVFGPRLTGSPQLRAAQEWAGKTMKTWGLVNVQLEPWEFGRQGWSNELTEISVVEPYQAPILARALPWTPSTKGLVTARVVLIAPPGMPPAGRRLTSTAGADAAARASTSPPPMPQAFPAPPPPTRPELATYLAGMRDEVRGAIVLVGPPAAPRHDFLPVPLRLADADWEARVAAPPRMAPGHTAEHPADDDGRLSLDEIHAEIAQFLVANGALVRVKDAGERRGLIRVDSTNGYGETPQVPGVAIANADYGRIARVLQSGKPVTMRVNVQNRFHPEGRTAYNIVGEISGSDKRDEVVMLGAHLDGWTPASGSADDAAGAAIMMEAMRLLQKVGAKPRRTIRIALWGGEEQGIYGSQAYVEKHFGSFENPKPDFAKFSAYINLDNGTGKPRAAAYFGPSEGAPIVAGAMAGFRDWGFVGATTASFRPVSDSAAFYVAGLPAIGLYQDPFDYISHLHHTNFDTYEEIYEPDVRIAAVEMAALAYSLAMREERLPRFGAHDMPPRDPAFGPRARVRPPENHGEP